MTIPDRLMPGHSFARALLFLCVFILHSPAADVVRLDNGDEIHGTLRELEQGTLHLDVDYGKNLFEIAWARVVYVETTSTLTVEMANGHRHTGTLTTSAEDPSVILIHSNTEVIPVPRHNIRAMLQAENGRWGAWKNSLDVGFSLARAGNANQISMGGATTYSGQRMLGSGKVNVVHASQNDHTVGRLDANGSVGVVLADRWFALTSMNFLSSSEQQLDLRSTVLAGVGRFIYRTSASEFSTLFGVAGSHEQFSTPDVASAGTSEGVWMTSLNAYGIRGTKVDFITNCVVYPGISERGRLRYTLASEMRWGLPKRLHFNVRFLNSFDNRPINNASKVDYVFTTGLGWTL